MRVALVCPYSLDVPGGVGTHVLGLADWLTGRGHRVVVIAPGTRIREAAGFEVCLVGGAVPLAFNGSVANLALGRSQAGRAWDAAAGADVVHVHEPLTPGIAHHVARLAPRPVVTHHASFEVPAVLGRLLRMRSARIGDRVTLAVSTAAATTARAVTGLEPRIIPNAISLPSPPPNTRSNSTPRVGFLGRIDEPRKGFPVFRELAVLARQADLRASFVAAGPGSASSGPVEMVGQVSDITGFLRSLDVLVAPNMGGESFGMVLVEALAAGCDVVASDLPAFAELLSEAGVGALFPRGDVTTLLDVLRGRLSDPPSPADAHAAARRWGWDRVGPAVLEAYAEALA